MSSESEFKKRFDEHRSSDIFNKLMAIAAAAYAWQLHSIWVGLIVLAALWLARRIIGNVLVAKWLARADFEDGSIDGGYLAVAKRIDRWRWAAVIAAFIIITATGAEMCSGADCHRLAG